MKQKKGFAVLTDERKKAIASAGGKTAHAKGKAHKFTSATAKMAGQKGGKAISENKEHMAAIGQKGGQVRSRNLGVNKYDEMIEKYENKHKNE